MQAWPVLHFSPIGSAHKVCKIRFWVTTFLRGIRNSGPTALTLRRAFFAGFAPQLGLNGLEQRRCYIHLRAITLIAE